MIQVGGPFIGQLLATLFQLLEIFRPHLIKLRDQRRNLCVELVFCILRSLGFRSRFLDLLAVLFDTLLEVLDFTPQQPRIQTLILGRELLLQLIVALADRSFLIV